ncbi:IS66 Orf2 like protein [Planctomycetes bacterium Pla163]|uniref:IS66 Orf2 like protein n=1 Tax=Rohdeia mirabilis TaxID=2528008 RepID=A0A518D5A4_9BACT|nr:IS66 Orf2 like protein [Planctomycetes bacterium Pla163]
MLSFPPSQSVRIFVGRSAVDMRKGASALSALVIDVIDEDPQSGHLFLFFNWAAT